MMHRIQGSLILIFVLLSTVGSGMASAQTDSTGITLQEADKRFLANNLQLLAARFNIDAARASIVQAQLWSNPNIAIEQNIYNQQTGRYFDFTKTGNTEIQIQQLILLAGKRNKQIKLAEINTQVAENIFFDLLRTLKYQLRTDFYDLFFEQQSIKFYNESIDSMQRTIAATEKIYSQRSILLSEVLRLKSLLFQLETEQQGLINQANENEQDMHVLLRDSTGLKTYYIPYLDRQSIDALQLDPVSLEQAIALAKEKRPDYKNAEASIRYEETNLSLQKSLAVPDLTVGGRWSRAGSYIPEYYALTFAIDIPFFNRNQGNIQVSEKTLEANKLLRENILNSLERDVTIAYKKASETDRVYKNFDKKFPTQYEELVRGMIANYQRRNMSIIEFTDFFESYRTSMLQINQLQNDRMDAFEALNYAVGTSVVNP